MGVYSSPFSLSLSFLHGQDKTISLRKSWVWELSSVFTVPATSVQAQGHGLGSSVKHTFLGSTVAVTTLGLYHIYYLSRFTSDAGCLPFQPSYKSSETLSVNLFAFLSYLDFLVFACEHPDSYQCGHRKPTSQLWGRSKQMLAIDGYVRETETSLPVSSKRGIWYRTWEDCSISRKNRGPKARGSSAEI